MSGVDTKKPEAMKTASDCVHSTEEIAQGEDEQLLSKNERDIEEILQLIEDNTDQTEAEMRLAEAQMCVDANKQGTVFHQHPKGNRKIALKHHASNLFKLSRALELSVKTKRYGKDLHYELETRLKKRVEVLKRINQRAGVY
jgi:hypothetical protein